ncbi:hypothetical protein [Acutalibacter caecimuris]|uniref:hypothetical protein n=1 Tax=Acutalibacter caecimuris TaxID=3093657 RepID=UPI002AC9C59F|nr:hypothetical protein [Acutalibacter sp. M00118]
MTAYEILAGLLEAFRAAIPEADFREAYGPETASRRLGRVLAAGQVERESTDGSGWQARLGFTVYLPPGRGQGQAQAVASAMETAARESQPLLAETVLGPVTADKTFGGTAMHCTFSFARPAGAGGGAGKGGITLDGKHYPVTGWKESVSREGEALVAMGEDVPFWEPGRTYTIELQGLGAAAMGVADGFTLRLEGPGWLYMGCRWKSRGSGGTAVAISRTKTVKEG